MQCPPSRILVLYWHHSSLKEMRAAIRHHLYTMENSSIRHDIVYYNALDGAPSWLRHCRFDAVILHTTFLCLRWSPFFYEWKWKLRWVGDLDCVKIALPQDEYDHSEILDEWLYEWGISIIGTNFDETKRAILYPLMQDKAAFLECFTGYIDESIAVHYQKALSKQSRSNDVVYRATHLPYWFGSHGQLKHDLADVVAQRARTHGLTCDISTREVDTIVGDAWLAFLASGRAVIGCESGSSVLDRRGEIRAQIQAALRVQPDISFQEVSEQLPHGWDDCQFFAISPRHFEAVMTKTCQVLVEGTYNGVFQPETHYIPLKRDFSNMGEVLDRLRDDQYVQNIVERAYQDIYLSGKYTYRSFASGLEKALAQKQDRFEGTINVFNRLMWPLAHLQSRIVMESVSINARCLRSLKAIKQIYDAPALKA